MKEILWQGRLTQTAVKYGEVTQTATVCCNACRTCMQTNAITFGLAAIGAAGAWVARVVKRPRAGTAS